MASGGGDGGGDAAALERVRGWLGRTMRVTLSDGRVVTGQFHCLDWLGNAMLKLAEVSSPSAPGQVRVLGLVCIPARHAVSFELQGPPGAPAC